MMRRPTPDEAIACLPAGDVVQVATLEDGKLHPWQWNRSNVEAAIRTYGARIAGIAPRDLGFGLAMLFHDEKTFVTADEATLKDLEAKIRSETP